MIERISFNSIEEWLESMPFGGYQKRSSSKLSFFGESHEESLKHARYGQPELVKRAEKLLEQMPIPETEGLVYQMSPMGAYLVVPEYLVGFPMSMRSKQYVPDEGKPIRVFANGFLSAGISLEQGLKRGLTIAALIMRLQQTHPIELTILGAHGGYGNNDPDVDTLMTVNVGVLPIDLSVLTFLLASPSCYRNLFLTTNCLYDGKFRHSLSAKPNDVKKALGIGESDLYVHSLVLGDELTNDPIAWIQKQIVRFNHSEDILDEGH